MCPLVPELLGPKKTNSARAPPPSPSSPPLPLGPLEPAPIRNATNTQGEVPREEQRRAGALEDSGLRSSLFVAALAFRPRTVPLVAIVGDSGRFRRLHQAFDPVRLVAYLLLQALGVVAPAAPPDDRARARSPRSLRRSFAVCISLWSCSDTWSCPVEMGTPSRTTSSGSTKVQELIFEEVVPIPTPKDALSVSPFGHLGPSGHMLHDKNFK